MILGLDTTGAYCSVVIRDGDTLRADLSERIGRGHAEVLGVMVERAFAQSGLAPDDITRVAVCRGPGSFTGLRVGLSFALGFALSRQLPVIGLDAARIAAHGTQGHGMAGDVVVRIDVRRGEVGWASYRDGLETRAFKVEAVDDADVAIASLGHRVIHDPVPDMGAATAIAMVADPVEFPATALYARAPDAKLPGGIEPNASSNAS